MKTKTLYLIIFLLAVIIIFALIYTKGKISELNQPISEDTRVEPLDQERIDGSTGPIFFHKESITVIKPARGKVDTVSESDKIKDFKDQQDLALASQSQGASSGSNGQDTEKAAGVTTSGKYPPKEKIEELNSKGIIIY